MPDGALGFLNSVPKQKQQQKQDGSLPILFLLLFLWYVISSWSKNSNNDTTCLGKFEISNHVVQEEPHVAADSEAGEYVCTCSVVDVVTDENTTVLERCPSAFFFVK